MSDNWAGIVSVSLGTGLAAGWLVSSWLIVRYFGDNAVIAVGPLLVVFIAIGLAVISGLTGGGLGGILAFSIAGIAVVGSLVVPILISAGTRRS